MSASCVNLTPKGQEIFPVLAKKYNNTMSIMQMHRDIVYELPKDTELLVTNDICEVQGFYRPNSILTVQGHPEFTAEFEQILITLRKSTGVLSELIADNGLAKVNDRNDGLVIAEAIVKFIEQ